MKIAMSGASGFTGKISLRTKRISGKPFFGRRSGHL